LNFFFIPCVPSANDTKIRKHALEVEMFFSNLPLTLAHYATSRKVAGLIPDEVIGFFNLPNPSSRTMALGSTQPLTEMSTTNLPGG
jgi:hypothetical protein